MGNAEQENRPADGPTARPGWRTAARVSLIAFLTAVGALALGVAAIWTGLRPGGGFFPDIEETHAIVAALCALGALLGIPTSIVSGLIAVRHQRVVLWWVVPLVCVAALVIGAIVDAVS
ncbi:MAG: hypothetical protein JXR37_06830 [Kiritimatiellae bacterium]|nr:hypothetical protein [Kiritimatiellia bacterium]